MPRESKPHLHKGYWRTRINGATIYLGKDERKAKAEFHRLMRDKFKVDTSDRPETVAGIVAAWLDLNDRAAIKDRLRAFVKFAADEYLDDVDADLLARYHLHLKRQKALRRAYNKTTKTWSMKPTNRRLSNETIRNYVRTAAKMLRWAHKRKWLSEAPEVPALGSSQRNDRDVGDDRLQAAFESLPDRAGRPLRFIAETGCRPGEACKLKWEYVHLDVGTCILPVGQHKSGTKTGKPRTIYLTPGAVEILSGMRPTVGHVFLSRFGKPYTPSGLRSILRRHGGITPYQLRHSFAQRASEQQSTEDLAKLLGNTERAARFYFEVRDKRAIQVARSLRPTIKMRKPA